MIADGSGHIDCVIIGGGPAGATAGAVLGMHGRRVAILERETFPRHHIGESLMPHTYDTFKRIGMIDKLKDAGFPTKQSVQFVGASGKESSPFYFPDWNPADSSYTWQVKRDRFDQIMLDNARELGATVIQPARVTRVLFDGDGKCQRAVGVQAIVDGADQRIDAKVIIDASGQGAILSRQLDLRHGDAKLRNGAIYAYYENAQRDQGRNAGATIIISTPDRTGWFWSIPLSDTLTSIGLVGPPSYLFTGRGDDPAATMDAEIAACPAMAGRLENATRTSRVYVTSDFSYRSSRLAGDGWILTGDAFGFLDPVYSSGLMLALRSGEWAADAVHDALNAGDVSGERLGAFGGKFIAGMQLLRQLVYAFYDAKFSFAHFTRTYPQYKDHLIRMLIGDVFNDEVGRMFEPMGEWIDLPGPIELDDATQDSGKAGSMADQPRDDANSQGRISV